MKLRSNFTLLRCVYTCIVVIGKFVCFIMFRSRSAISTTRNFVQSCACDSICATQKSLKERFAISTTRECRLKCMSLAINVQSSVTKGFTKKLPSEISSQSGAFKARLHTDRNF